MNKTTHNLIQGTSEWAEHRRSHYNASDASAMLGLSTYKSRNDLLAEKATGLVKEVPENVQRIFDEGHRFEAEARPIAELIIGDELYSPILSIEINELKLSASFDGLTLLEDLAWEHKTLNAKLEKSLSKGEIPEEYKPQLEQQLLVSGAKKCLFMASKGTEESMLYVWYKSDPTMRQALIDGWKQFEKDLANFEVKEAAPKVQAEYIPSLPALRVQINGAVTESNLSAYRETALAFISNINTDLVTDQDFANAENTIKFCKNAEKELAQVKRNALAQTASIDDLFRTVDDLSEAMRQKRLEIDKLVKQRKDFIRLTIMTDVKQRLQNLWEELVMDCSKQVVPEFCPVNIDVMEAMKGKKTLDSLQNAAESELARASIEAEKLAERFETNLALFDEEAPHCQSLFRDLNDLIYKEPEDFKAVVLLRVAEYEAEQERRKQAEEERIRNEERAKLQAEQTKQEVVTAPAQEQPKPVKKLSPLMLEIGSWAKAKGLSKHDLEELKAILLNHGYEIAA